MSVWDDVVGQPAVVEELRRAVDAAHTGGGAAMTHAWLFTGPPGSGRSTAARAFAAALLDPLGGDQETPTSRAALDGHHPDLTVVATDRSLIRIEEVRELVGVAQRSPSGGPFRIMLVEDADRMAERTSNVLLKAIEEPPPSTVWLLCAPSPTDVMTTIRSRCRNLNLRIPSTEDVSAVLQRRYGVPADRARWAALASQHHIGRARHLATDDEAANRRERVLAIPGALTGVGPAVRLAEGVLNDATDAAKARTEERDATERSELLAMLGVDSGSRVPPSLRSQIRELEENQKRRSTRARADEIDRILIDLLSLYRDGLMRQFGFEGECVNEGQEPRIAAIAAHPPTEILRRIDAITQARSLLRTNTAPQLVLEALFLKLR